MSPTRCQILTRRRVVRLQRGSMVFRAEHWTENQGTWIWGSILPLTTYKHTRISLSLVTSSDEWEGWTQRSQRHLPVLIFYNPMSLPGRLVEKHLPPVDLYWNRGECKNTNSYQSQQGCCLPLHVNPWIFTCSSNWKFFSKTRSMWSRKAECSCSCRFPRLSFKRKRKGSQVVERLKKWRWWWDIPLTQSCNNFAYWSKGGL